MSVPAPHFLLFSNARQDRPPHEPAAGQWRFVLEAVDGSLKLEATDAEAEISRDRLELLAIVRGLEALDQPSMVTVVTSSRYISRGLRFGLPTWRENGWQWERFGQLVAVKNADLWQRIDRAMKFHRLACRFRPNLIGIASQLEVEQEVAPELLPAPAAVSPTQPTPAATRRPGRRTLWKRLGNSLDNWTRSLGAAWSKPQLGNAAY